MSLTSQRVFVAGHRGMAGSAIVRELRRRGYEHIVTRSRTELDLIDQAQVKAFFETENIGVVYLAAAKVGGILANDTYPADFLYDNLMIEANVIQAAHAAGVERLVFLGSSCIYPKHAEQPMHEDALLTGPLEPTNEAYAIAKIAGLKLCEAYARQHGARYICAMPTNLYGENDSYDLNNSHVLPALIRKFHEAREANSPTVTLWGSGKPLREFLYVDDLASACVTLAESDAAAGVYNVGAGSDITIADLATIIGEVVGYDGEIVYDATKPDGTPRKLLDSSRMQGLGWQAQTGLRDGIAQTYAHYLAGRVHGAAPTVDQAQCLV
ncbi:GDP-L-fucose synthase [Schauerella aestuarii]|uniref:GDP-L-fucose synthase n=1 Tax=Schauerella aestuarii TaxID=2511204 RepID=UPI00136C1583|nr:GDP-L-fucose synthase [Achromobacter aestuarii]MYZ45744.1 GDP-L-fucose synthase [Achromobacter aestuarii]